MELYSIWKIILNGFQFDFKGTGSRKRTQIFDKVNSSGLNKNLYWFLIVPLMIFCNSFFSRS